MPKESNPGYKSTTRNIINNYCSSRALGNVQTDLNLILKDVLTILTELAAFCQLLVMGELQC